jgi:hypothetical protein
MPPSSAAGAGQNSPLGPAPPSIPPPSRVLDRRLGTALSAEWSTAFPQVSASKRAWLVATRSACAADHMDRRAE